MVNEIGRGLTGEDLEILEKAIRNIENQYIESKDELLNELFYGSLCKMKEACKNVQYVFEMCSKQD